MPRRGMKAPAGVTCFTVAEGRRSRGAAALHLIDFTNRPLHPAQPDPLTAMKNLFCAVGVVRASPGRISALAPLALTGVYSNPEATLLTATRKLVTTSIRKPLCFNRERDEGSDAGRRCFARAKRGSYFQSRCLAQSIPLVKGLILFRNNLRN